MINLNLKHDKQYIVLFVEVYKHMLGDQRRVHMDDVASVSLQAALAEAYSLRNENLIGILECDLKTGETKQLYNASQLHAYISDCISEDEAAEDEDRRYGSYEEQHALRVSDVL